ncbi:MAG: peptidoglycan DD-metalloendopeptidase family protein [Methylophilaceae bacterium]
MCKRLIPYLLCLFTLSLLAGVNTSFANKKTDTAKKDISGIQKKIKRIKKKLNKTKEQQHDVADALKKSETAISIANKELLKIKEEQKQNETKLNQLKKKSLSINEKLGLQQKQLGKLLYQQYAQGNQSYAKLILQSKSPSQISRDLKYQSYIAKAHTKLIDDMQSNLNKIKTLDTQTSNTLQKVSQLKKHQESERKTLEKQKAEKALVLKKLSKEIAAQRGQIKKLKRDEKRLSRLVAKLAKIAKKNRAKKKKKVKKKKSSKIIATNRKTPDNRYAGKKFSSLRGKLKLPVKGQVMNRFGRKRKDSGVTWKGLFIRAKAGATVKSVATGRVVFAEWMRGFGNLIIVDHGSGYMSLYGNNQTILKNVGEAVKGGDTIAAVGNTGGNKSNGLYYELRKKSIPFDPLKWSSTR